MIAYEENFKSMRCKMVSQQLEARGIKASDVLDAFRSVPRHSFVDPSMQDDAYSDFPLSIGKGQTISQPYIVALMVEALGIIENDKVLEIGTGSGYQTAILSELRAYVFSIERIEGLADKAKDILTKLKYSNIRIKVGDGTLGWQEFAPFDKIVVTASTPFVPHPLLGQLAKNGKMVVPIGPRFSQRLILLQKDAKGSVSERDICGCVFVPLIGKFGWKEGDAGKDN